MKIFLFFAILILGFTAAITAAVKPEMFEQKFMEVRAPIDQYMAEKRDLKWKEIKDQERSVWMKNKRLPSDCASPRTAIREIECNNKKQQLVLAFEQEWSDKVRNGWEPD